MGRCGYIYAGLCVILFTLVSKFHGQVKYVTDRLRPKKSHFEINKKSVMSVIHHLHYLPYILTLYLIHFIDRSVIYRIKMKKYRYKFTDRFTDRSIVRFITCP